MSGRTILAPAIADQFDSVEPVYSWLDRLRGLGGRNHELFTATAGASRRVKVLTLSAAGQRSAAARDNLVTCAELLEQMRHQPAAPTLIHADATTIVVEWVEGDMLSAVPMSLELASNLARTCAGSLIGVQEQPAENPGALIESRTRRLAERGLLPIEVAKTFVAVALERLELPEVELSAICFADAALKNYVLSPHGTLHYVDLLGVYRTSVEFNMLRHSFMLPGPMRAEFIGEFLATVDRTAAERHLGYFYVAYLLQIALAKSVGGSFWLRKRRLRRAHQAVACLQDFIAGCADGRPAIEHVVSRASYM